MKQRTGKQQYVQHAKHVLEKTQTEAYLEFRDFHPEIQVKQRKFENLKPFFVKQAKERDRKSCLCRKHDETKMVFSACMKFGKATPVNSNEYFPIPTTLTECVDLTLCPKPDGSSHHQIKCLERECSSCGIDGFKLPLEETCQEGSVRWSCYEYVPTGKFFEDGQEKKKISLVQKDTSPFQLFKRAATSLSKSLFYGPLATRTA